MHKRQNGDRAALTQQEEKELKRKQTLEQELTTYSVETASGLLPRVNDGDQAGLSARSPQAREEVVACLWEDRQSIFFYDRDRLA